MGNGELARANVELDINSVVSIKVAKVEKNLSLKRDEIQREVADAKKALRADDEKSIASRITGGGDAGADPELVANGDGSATMDIADTNALGATEQDVLGGQDRVGAGRRQNPG